MADPEKGGAKQLLEITECPICMSPFNDPRMLPCIHTFCFECLKRTAEANQKNPGDMLPCPLCRKDFTIPEDGMNGVQKNFFMENLMEFKTTLQIGSAIICDMCNVRNEGLTGDIPTATMRCLECQDNYCDSCVKVHQFQKLIRNHQFVKIGSDAASKMKRPLAAIFCSKHTQKLLDYYCSDCKKIVCVSCFVESHASHKCKDVTSVDEEFRQTIQIKSSKVSSYAEKMLFLKKKAEIRKADFLKEILNKEKAIHRRNQELKDMIDDHTKLLLDQLSQIKSKNLKELDTQVQEIERCCTILRSFEAYCTELVAEGSASDICSSVEQIIVRADELESDHESLLIDSPHQSTDVSFQITDLREVLQKSSNILGHIKEIDSQYEKIAISVLESNVRFQKAVDVMKINLERPNEISPQEGIPTTTKTDVVGAVYCNTMYVSGLGTNNDEIWKFDLTTGWMKCASLFQGRRRHSAAFIDEVLYICGGFSDSNRSVLDCVETFDAVTDKCNTVGKLVHCVQNAGNCVPFRSSLYIFGGKDKYGKDSSHVQVYNTKQNTCILLTTPMPRPGILMRALLWETSAILLGQNICLIFDFEAETWQEREQFKAGVRHFGLILVNESVFVIGGGNIEKDKSGNAIWKCRDDVRYVPLQNILHDKAIEWKIHGKLPRPSLVPACGVMRMTV